MVSLPGVLRELEGRAVVGHDAGLGVVEVLVVLAGLEVFVFEDVLARSGRRRRGCPSTAGAPSRLPASVRASTR